MNFKDGMVAILLPFFGMILTIICNLFQKEIEAKEIVKKRLVKYFIASIGIVFIYFIIVYGILNRNFLFKVSSTDNYILLSIFLTSMFYFYLNSMISTFVMRHLDDSDTSKKIKLIKCIGRVVGNYSNKTKRSIIMICSQFIFLSLTIVFCGFYNNQKSIVVEDTIVSYSKGTFKLPAESTFKPVFELGKPSNLKNSPVFTYNSQDNVYILPKGSEIELFKGTELIVENIENENLVYQKEKDKYLDKLKPSKKTTVTLNRNIKVNIERDSKIILSKIDNIFVQWIFIHLGILYISLSIYYFCLLLMKR